MVHSVVFLFSRSLVTNSSFIHGQVISVAYMCKAAVQTQTRMHLSLLWVSLHTHTLSAGLSAVDSQPSMMFALLPNIKKRWTGHPCFCKSQLDIETSRPASCVHFFLFCFGWWPARINLFFLFDPIDRTCIPICKLISFHSFYLFFQMLARWRIESSSINSSIITFTMIVHSITDQWWLWWRLVMVILMVTNVRGHRLSLCVCVYLSFFISFTL